MTSAQPASPPRRSRARRGEGERLREEIVAATADLLERTGDEDQVSIRAIAEAVGVSPPSIYLHFPDKTALMFAVCEDRFRQLDRVMEEAARAATDPFDEIRRRAEAYIRFGLDHPEQYRILFMERDEPTGFSEEHLADASAFDHMVEAVSRAMGAGLIADADPAVVTIGLWAAVHGLTSLLIAKPNFPWPPIEELRNQVLAMCCFGVTAGSRESSAVTFP
jgi:AcrR family transcriptional regulator